jgi:hypothetical protein
VLGLVPNAAAAGSSAREVAAGLRSDPVYVADSEREQLSVAERGRLRLRILRKDIGRIQIAVMSPRSAERAGGLGELANAVDQAMPGRRGALVATTGTAFHVLGVIIVAASIAIPFLLGAMALLMALRRRRAAAEDREELDRGDARDELIALGEEIQALDLDVEMPDASPRGREEYERALRLYDRANLLLGKDDPGEVELYEARRSLEEGRSRIAAAREALTPGQSA